MVQKPRRVFISLLVFALAVIAGPLAGTSVACETGSWVRTDPPSGHPGDTIAVRGGGFEPGEVLLRWDASDGEVLGSTEVGDDGSIRAEVVVPEARPGMHKVVAEHAESGEQVAHADAWDDFEIPAGGGARSNADDESSADATEGTTQAAHEGRPERTAEQSRSVDQRPAGTEQSPAEEAGSLTDTRSRRLVATASLARKFESATTSPGAAEMIQVSPDAAMLFLSRDRALPEERGVPIWSGWAVAGILLIALVAFARSRLRPRGGEIVGLPVSSPSKKERRAA